LSSIMNDRVHARFGIFRIDQLRFIYYSGICPESLAGFWHDSPATGR